VIGPGTKLANYEVVSALGKGGMGEVWRARDTKLGREVAIKTLPAQFAQDADRLARFEREAKLLASLNHPNIAAIYGLEEHDGFRFLVLELVEGDTLADRLHRGPIPIEDSLKLALQIVEALEAAHEEGVVHRDLKPANIKVTKDHKVKILDFGLAKAFNRASGTLSSKDAPTLSIDKTRQGEILGTPAYMAPEQARGESTDTRTDVWGVGVVLFEMLTGKRVFAGQSVSHILAEVLKSEPVWANLPAKLHTRIRLLLERCLEKESRDRYASISDARVDIERVLSGRDLLMQILPESAPTRTRSNWLWIAALVVGVVGAGVGGWTFRSPPTSRLSRWTYELPEGQVFLTGSATNGGSVVIFSPDGSQFAYNTSEGMYLRRLADDGPAQLIPGTDLGNLRTPVFSPDGTEIAYGRAIAGEPWQLVAAPVTGEGYRLIADDVPMTFGMRWNDDNTITYAGPAGIYQVAANGGDPDLIVEAVPGESIDSPQLLPGGDWVMFTSTTATGPDRWNQAQIVAARIGADDRRGLVAPGADGHYLPSGHIVYAIEDRLHAIAFDLDQMATSDPNVAMVEGLVRESIPAVQTGTGNFTISTDGSLAYASFQSLGESRMLAFADGNGNQTTLDVPPRGYWRPRLSPTGDRIAVEVTGQQGSDIWVMDLINGTDFQPFTQNGTSFRPIWGPDGDSLFYASNEDGPTSVYMRPLDGRESTVVVATAPAGFQYWPESWSPRRRHAGADCVQSARVRSKRGHMDVSLR